MFILAEEFNSPILGIIIWACFGAIIVFILIKSFIGAKKTAKKKANTTYDDYSIINEHSKEYDKEPLKKYYFHYTGKLNQNHVLEDENHKVIYEANKEHITLTSAEEFEFINHVSNKKSMHKIGHTITSTTSVAGLGMAHSKFSFDDEKNIWQYLEAAGYSYKTDLKKLSKPCYIISYEGNEIGTIQLSGICLLKNKNVKKPMPNVVPAGFGPNHVATIQEMNYAMSSSNQTNQSTSYSKIPAPGHYRVECKDSDLDAIFLFCLAFARTESSQEHYKNNNLFE